MLVYQRVGFPDLCKGLSYNVRPPATIAFSWGSHNSNVTMVYGIFNELVTEANLNQLIILGASHCRISFEVKSAACEPFLRNQIKSHCSQILCEPCIIKS